MKNRLTWVAALVAIVVGAATLHAQTAAPAKAEKIGVINMQAAIANTAEGKKVIADLQRKYAPRQAELQDLQREIQAIQDQLSKQQATLSEDEQARLSRQAEEKQTQLKRSAEDAQNDFNLDRDESINRIGQKMVRVISDFASKNGFSLVLDDAQIPVYYAAKDIELTAEIVKRYDAANPVADGGATPKPAANPGPGK
jgi:outer membrane protein